MLYPFIEQVFILSVCDVLIRFVLFFYCGFIGKVPGSVLANARKRDHSTLGQEPQEPRYPEGILVVVSMAEYPVGTQSKSGGNSGRRQRQMGEILPILPAMKAARGISHHPMAPPQGRRTLGQSKTMTPALGVLLTDAGYNIGRAGCPVQVIGESFSLENSQAAIKLRNASLSPHPGNPQCCQIK